MKHRAMFILGVALTVATLPAQVNSGAEERYRAKYGRHTQAYKAEEKAPAKVVTPACCRNMNAAFKNETRESFADALFSAKYGRSTPRIEARREASGRGECETCREVCSAWRVHADAGRRKLFCTRKEVPANSWGDEYYRAEYGRALDTTGEETRVTAPKVTCEHDCCRRTD